MLLFIAACASHTNARSSAAVCTTTSHHERCPPKLILAPMQVLADAQFRRSLLPIGGMHEAVQEFIRISLTDYSAVRGAVRAKYDPHELDSVPLAAQIMGGNAAAMGTATTILADMGAKRVDLNCGCPSKRVNGRGAGASLLKDPGLMYDVARSMVDAVKGRDVCVSVKIRSGYESADLFDDNVLAVKEAGVHMLTVHPRTKKQGYEGKADWSFIRRAKNICRDAVQVVGNGDVTSASDAMRMLDETGCDHIMIGRGAVANPWIFWDVRKALEERYGWDLMDGCVTRNFDSEKLFYEEFVRCGAKGRGLIEKVEKARVGRLKMMLGYATWLNEEERKRLLRFDGQDVMQLLDLAVLSLRRSYQQNEARVRATV